jgi:hypothetical protein
MIKLASVALTTVLGVAGIAAATSANADPYFRAEVTVPRLVVEPFAVGPGYYSRYYGYRGYDRGRFEHGRWGHGWDRRGYRR